MICRKMEKGKTIAIIAEELEEKEDEIKKIYDIALKYAPNYDSEQIYAELNKDKVSSNCVFEPDSDYPAPINSPSKNQ